MKKIAITGGMGAGKSTACKIFEKMGIPVFEADKVVKELYDTDTDLMIEMIKSFGSSIYNDTWLNRTKLAEIIFNDREKLFRVNKIVAPFLKRELDIFCEEQKRVNNPPFIIMEAAIVYELGFQDQYDYIIYVTAPEEVRVERIKERDGLTYDEIGARLRNFLPENEKIIQADFVIDTFRPQVSLAEQCWEIFLTLSKADYMLLKCSQWENFGMNSKIAKDIKEHYVNLRDYETAAYFRGLELSIEKGRRLKN